MQSAGPRRSRNDDKHFVRLSGITCVSPQTASLSSRALTTCPARPNRRRKAASSLGGRWMVVVPRKSVPSDSRRKPANERDPGPGEAPSNKALLLRSNVLPRRPVTDLPVGCLLLARTGLASALVSDFKTLSSRRNRPENQRWPDPGAGHSDYRAYEETRSTGFRPENASKR